MMNNFKFYIMTYFVQYIRNYNNIINYNKIYSKIVYKYFLKLFIIKLIKIFFYKISSLIYII